MLLIAIFEFNIERLFENNKSVYNQNIPLDLFSISNFILDIKREDHIHPLISGNKYRKLKYNIRESEKLNSKTLLTFGGAYSNHIAAMAVIGKEGNIKTIGVIRGDELVTKINENPTLSLAQNCGMKFHFISRKEYRHKNNSDFIDKLNKLFGDFYLVPEGGTNELAVKGCEEILTEEDSKYDYICAAVGTGGTLAGLINSSLPHQKVIGFSALKGIFQSSEINKYSFKTNFKVLDNYCFGGFAKIDPILIRFINEFKEKTDIQLDPIYTGKMMFGIIDLLKRKKLKENSRILAIHTGGLQGIEGMNLVLKKKNLPQINV